jgi:hypothetical protein
MANATGICVVLPNAIGLFQLRKQSIEKAVEACDRMKSGEARFRVVPTTALWTRLKADLLLRIPTTPFTNQGVFK